MMFLSALKITGLVYLGFGLYLYLAQRALMYFPVAENPARDLPHELISSSGETLKVWVVDPGQPEAVIYFGGNAEDVYFNADDFRRWLPGRTVYLVNYRGYGGSSGSPSEQGLYDDALAVFDQVRQRHDAVSVIGRSLGSAVATFLASRRPAMSLVLVTPPDSALAVARRLYPFFPVGWMLKDRYETVAFAPAVEQPVLIITAQHDRVVPAEHAETLAAAFRPGQVRWLTVDGAGHNDLSAHTAYWRGMAEFVGAADAATGR